MYGKIFASMYEGSMVGAGPLVFAVWGYCIAKADIDGTVLLNPALLAPVIGTSTESIRQAVDFLQQPDEHSKNPDHDGRRLLHQSGHLYFVVSHEIYRGMKSNEDRREYMREYMRTKRSKVGVNSLQSLQDLTKANPASASVSASVQERGCKGETKEPKPKPELAQPCFDSPAFLQAWQDWQEHRREIKKPLTPRASQEQMKEFRAWGEVRAIKAIRHTIKNQWIGIREADAQPNANKPQVYQCH